MALTTIASDGMQITVDSKGAQLMSLRTDAGEYLWQGDERWWPRRAPVLFPIVGNIRRDQASSAAGPISLKRHGLARNEEFELVEDDGASLAFRLRSSEATRAQFPYDFELELAYRIEGASLEQRFTVTNAGAREMPYVVGGHPAFNVPAPGAEAEDFSEYRLEFAERWTYATPRIDTESGLLDFDDRISLLDDADTLALDHATFDIDTLVFEDVPQRTVTLAGPSGAGMRVDFDGFDYLGVWSAAGGAPFVALEPWLGCATAADEDDVFEHKRGMQVLAPGETRTHAFTMTPLAGRE